VKSKASATAAIVLALTTLTAAEGCSPAASDRATASVSTSATALTVTRQEPTPTEPAPPPDPGVNGWEAVGTSVQGRPIRVLTLGRGPRKVLFIGGIHGDEAEGAVATAELPAAFDAAGLADRVTLTIMEDANPDGRAAGTRDNANGVDVNRNFPASNFNTADPLNGEKPLSQPESRAVNDTIDRIQPNLVLVAHAWAGRQFINFDGPAREIAERFAASSGLPVEESSSFAPTPGSLGSYFGRDRGIPVLTIEVLKGSDPKVVWDQLRAAVLQAVAG
jgi:murein peptide amidase A